ncbi:hypothetical protein [Streptomyces sp. NPDC007984]|uniref:hypothetical protein n=1 Tax=Streptomyces sp. NPDC007984 TaxID=3364801 RepID=UPI0036EF0046
MFTSTTDRTLFTRGTAMLVSALTAGAILTASTGAHAAEATPRTTAPVSVAAEAADDAADDAQWEALLTSMLSIPEDVLEQGDAATAAYLKQQETRHKPPRGQRFGWPRFGCMGAVAVAIGTVGVKRIVSAIKAIRKSKGRTLADDLQWVGAQLLGLEGVKAACR